MISKRARLFAAIFLLLAWIAFLGAMVLVDSDSPKSRQDRANPHSGGQKDFKP